MAATYIPIASTTLSSSAASVTFSSIPQTYTDLVLRVSARGDTAGVGLQVRTTLNGNSSSIYGYTMIQGTGSTAQSSRLASTTRWSEAWIPGSSATADTFNSWELYIPSYTTSQNKQISSFSTTENNATESYISSAAYSFGDTTTVSQLSIVRPSGNFASGSTFHLYGISNT